MKSYKGCGTLGHDYPLTLDIPHRLRDERGDIKDDIYQWCREHLQSPWTVVNSYSGVGSLKLTTDNPVNLVHFTLTWL